MLDLSGSALRMQATSMGGQPMQRGAYPQPNQTTVTIAIPPPAEFARSLTELLTPVLVKTNASSYSTLR